ncbi:MAG: T9SS type A sorting domain-containing protein [Bacteroidetes bacterium]|nr:T9SS type A sorting domain-containing protein [Bacteroidota bacterium]
MKKQSVRFLAMMIGVAFISLIFSTVLNANPSGVPSPYNYTGSPGDTRNCVSCHGGSALTVTGWITSNIPAQGYTAGSTYTITVTATGTGRKGFELSPQNASGTQLGVLAAGTGSKLVGGTKYVTHTSAGSSTGTSVWSFSWTAPAAGTGTVTFYSAITVAKSNTKLTKLIVNEYLVVPLTASANATPSTICAGQTSQLNAAATGGSGTYTYSWTSNPAGFTSSLQNPQVSPTVLTMYMVQVSDGTSSAEATTDVVVNQPATAAAGNDTTCAYITTTVPVNGVATSYSTVLWSSDGTGIFTAADALSGYYVPSEADKAAGNVTLTLTASPFYFDSPTGMQDTPGTQIGMSISPNPCTGLFKIRMSGFDNKEAVITISDITGRTITQRESVTSVNRSEQFDLSGNPQGLYLVKVQTDNQLLVGKLVIK